MTLDLQLLVEANRELHMCLGSGQQVDFKCVYRSLIYAPRFVLWRRLTRLPDALRCVSPWHPRCFMLNALCTRPLFILSLLLFLLLLFSFLFCLVRRFVPQTCSLGALFPIATGVGPRAVSEFVGSSCQGHTQASLPSCQVGCALASFLLSFALTHTRCQP